MPRSEREQFPNTFSMNHPPRRSADFPVVQITAFRPPWRLEQTPLKSSGSLSPLSPLRLYSCRVSGGLTTEDTEKEGLGDGADSHRSKPQASCTMPTKRFGSSYSRPDPAARRMGCSCIADFPVGWAGPRPTAARLADGPACLETCATSDGRRSARQVRGLNSRPFLKFTAPHETHRIHPSSK